MDMDITCELFADEDFTENLGLKKVEFNKILKK